MIVQGANAGEHTAIFANVEYSDTANAVARGELTEWDLTDNTVTAVNRNTRGLRVILKTTASANTNHCGIAEQDCPAQPGAATANGRMILVQVYGHHNAVKITDTVARAPGVLWLMAAGLAGEPQLVVTPGSNGDAVAFVGTLLDATTASTTTKYLNAWIKCM